MELVTSFPDWVPKEVLRTARQLTEKEAASQLAFLLKLNQTPLVRHPSPEQPMAKR